MWRVLPRDAGCPNADLGAHMQDLDFRLFGTWAPNVLLLDKPFLCPLAELPLFWLKKKNGGVTGTGKTANSDYRTF